MVEVVLIIAVVVLVMEVVSKRKATSRNTIDTNTNHTIQLITTNY